MLPPDVHIEWAERPSRPSTGKDSGWVDQVLTRRRLLLGLALGAVVVGCGGDDSAAPSAGDDKGGPAAPGAVPSSVAGQPVDQAPPPTVATMSYGPISRTLRFGMSGDDVAMLQLRLRELRFDPWTVDGIFGEATQQAVWAYQKLVLGVPRRRVDGAVTPEVWQRMLAPLGVTPRRTNTRTYTHAEIYLPEQVMVIVKNGRIELISHISSGDGKPWTDKERGWSGVSVTPGGVFTFKLKRNDWYEGKLGWLYKPVFFNFGIAVHGYQLVPPYPDSHGCVRIPMHIAMYFPSLVSFGDLVYVWDGVKEPEVYGAQAPPFDTELPSDTSTSEGSTTAGSTTVAPSSTAAPTTRASVPATTAPTTAAPTTAAPTTKATTP
jgi:peptidoglycan hydrolase-like protein with peptidoglycan-binding domain